LRVTDDRLHSITPIDLYAVLGSGAAPVIIDVRRDPPAKGEHMLAGAAWRAPDHVDQWLSDLPKGRGVVAYCVDGSDVSREAVTSLRKNGVSASFLAGGLRGWTEKKLPLRRARGAEQHASQWVTREHPKIDRIACPWLVSRFIDPFAEFIYVPANNVASFAKEKGAIPYDINNVEFGHVGDRCSFDAIVGAYDIHDAALDHLATIVRGADTSRPDLTPQGEGLLAISYGLSSNFPDDHEMLKHGLVIYDAQVVPSAKRKTLNKETC
jgi:rhodanese-related sulfurtransferase